MNGLSIVVFFQQVELWRRSDELLDAGAGCCGLWGRQLPVQKRYFHLSFQLDFYVAVPVQTARRYVGRVLQLDAEEHPSVDTEHWQASGWRQVIVEYQESMNWWWLLLKLQVWRLWIRCERSFLEGEFQSIVAGCVEDFQGFQDRGTLELENGRQDHEMERTRSSCGNVG